MGSFQIGVLILCGVCLMLDGFDVQAIGYVAPAIKHDWHISDPVLGRVVSADDTAEDPHATHLMKCLRWSNRA